MNIPKMKIGDLTFKIPIIQGGMGVGVSRSSLASAVANEGGLGVISGAQIGFEELDFETNSKEANIRSLKNEIRKAKENSPDGFIGVNLMVAMKNYAEMVKAAVEAKVDVIISGAGLPLDLPALVDNTKVKIIPIASSLKAARIITTSWRKNYNREADAIIIEGPEAGGHLGFKYNELIEHKTESLESIVVQVIDYLKDLGKDVPVIAAGGIFNGSDIGKFLKMGASGVQMATRFVTTPECDASDEFKMAYINAKKEDIVITNSPVGLPGRALHNNFLKKLEITKKEAVTKCYTCLNHCNPAETPYCITKALVNSVKGNVQDGLLFVGSNVYKCNKMESVKEIISSLMFELQTV
ncbi:MAG: nitronate monooxygenase [Firmicutes bacterium HGW-Firmicutes-7]|nr:MAG: nitronate monooxygenase [Firmicutes bacterium HGW-Firmicutes-7]